MEKNNEIKNSINGIMVIADMVCKCDADVGFVCEMHHLIDVIQRGFYDRNKQIGDNNK